MLSIHHHWGKSRLGNELLQPSQIKPWRLEIDEDFGELPCLNRGSEFIETSTELDRSSGLDCGSPRRRRKHQVVIEMEDHRVGIG